MLYVGANNIKGNYVCDYLLLTLFNVCFVFAWTDCSSAVAHYLYLQLKHVPCVSICSCGCLLKRSIQTFCPLELYLEVPYVCAYIYSTVHMCV